jgi:hypothetical protein
MARVWPGERELPLSCRRSILPRIVTSASHRFTPVRHERSIRGTRLAGQIKFYVSQGKKAKAISHCPLLLMPCSATDCVHCATARLAK